MTPKIHPELKSLCRPLTPLEYDQLESSCVEEGILDAIKLWDSFILDGHNRFKIAEKHELEYEVQEIDLPDLDAAKSWVIDHQLGKRNVSDQEASKLRAMHAEITGDTKLVAEMHGVSQRTVQRDLEANEAKKLMSPDILERCERGSIINHRNDWKQYAGLTDSQRVEVDDRLRKYPTLTLAQAIPRDEASLPPGAYEKLNECTTLSDQQKMSISIGTIGIDKESLSAFLGLDDEHQILVANMLDDTEDMRAALKHLGNVKVPENSEKIVKSMLRAIDKLSDSLDKLQRARADNIGYKACRGLLDSLRNGVEAWK